MEGGREWRGGGREGGREGEGVGEEARQREKWMVCPVSYANLSSGASL